MHYYVPGQMAGLLNAIALTAAIVALAAVATRLRFSLKL